MSCHVLSLFRILLRIICLAVLSYVLSWAWITLPQDIPYESCLIFTLGNKLSVLMSHLELKTGSLITDTLLFLSKNPTCTMPMNHHENCLKVLNDSSSAPVQLWRCVTFKIDDVTNDVTLKKSSSSRSSTNSLPFSKVKGNSVVVVKSIFIWPFCRGENNKNVVKTKDPSKGVLMYRRPLTGGPTKCKANKLW